MTQNMTPEHDPSTPVVPSQPLSGEVVGVEDERVRVRLETGLIGFIARTAEGSVMHRLSPGTKGMFRVEQVNEDNDPVLDVVSIHESQAPASFDQDVDRLQDAISQHHAPRVPHALLTARDEIVPTMDEQRIQQWLTQVNKSLDKLRRNRAKRLDGECDARS